MEGLENSPPAKSLDFWRKKITRLEGKKIASSRGAEAPLKSTLRRVHKENTCQISGGDEEMMLHKDALLAFSESARIFIHYISATANDICKESNRQTISAEDVFKAIEDMEFPEFIQPLRASLEEFRRKNAVKRSGTKGKEATKKRKSEEELPAQDDDDDADVAEDAVEKNKEDEDDA
ncbi:hypothetical protein KSP39_PZI020880 [Platanthera zijinensis]|uniref:Transcription factor CBF/NF-Y/archaeal histone domain-containing protein n=1 Tax=Platanthera zijinensis TaxID=2320716 RepID=A0AAP0AZE6_9ASPA